VDRLRCLRSGSQTAKCSAVTSRNTATMPSYVVAVGETSKSDSIAQWASPCIGKHGQRHWAGAPKSYVVKSRLNQTPNHDRVAE
jgi:hypothetical protein